jgi:beta-lactam-binding protein with PASTA domain
LSPVHSFAMDTAVSDPLVGRMIDGRYHVEGRIARGGMAAVYYAVDTRLDRPVALKVMHAGLSDDQQFVHRFIGEAKTAARLSHPNVVGVFDQGTYEGLVYLAMEYVEGRTLREILGEYGPLTPRQAFGVLEPVLAALGAAHQAGLVHRDVKPENILLADDGRVKVADFGLARATTQATAQTSDGILLGTVAYLSPEQVSRGVSDLRSDVYSAGIVLYEMLTGQKPFTGESSMEIAYQHVHQDVPAPSEKVPSLSPMVDAIVARATRRDPAQRQADAAAMLAELTGVAQRMSDAELDAGGAKAGRHASNEPVTRQMAQVDGQTAADQDGAEQTAVVPAQQRASARGSSRARKSRQRRIGTLIAVAGAALLVAGLAWWLGSGAKTNVPNVRGMTQAAATKAVQDAGLKVQVSEPAFSEDVQPGLVAGSEPAPGSRVDRGSAVILHLSKGPERHEVPDLRGKTVAQAQQLLAGQNLKVGKVTRAFSTSVPKNRITSTDPAAGEEVRRNTAIALVISKGPEPVEVPVVTGRNVTEATQLLQQAGFRVTTRTAASDNVARDLVISQKPSGGNAPRGSTVELTVSTGPPLVTVPDVRNKQVGRAQQLLEGAGLRVSVLRLPGGPGIVLAQSPGPGSQAPKGSTVRISVF